MDGTKGERPGGTEALHLKLGLCMEKRTNLLAALVPQRRFLTEMEQIAANVFAQVPGGARFAPNTEHCGLNQRADRSPLGGLDFSGDYISLAPTFLWRLDFSGLDFSGDYIFLVTTILQRL